MKKNKVRPSGRSGFFFMEVILSLFIFMIVAASFTKGLAMLWRNTSFVKEELTISQIMESALYETLYLQRLEEGSFEVYVKERDVDLETIVTPLELENMDGVLLQQMWEVRVIARYQQDGFDEEREVRGWRYLPLYRPQ
ncbi:MAG: hypothetical protein PVJ98_03540 [Akkermansiaceae bacterium]|jgi:hypothetical protein